MKIYIRKIDNQCVEKQISILKSVVDDFFGPNLLIEDNSNAVGGKIIKFIGVDVETGKEGYIRILPQTDPRFSSSDIKNLISKPFDINDLLVFYEKSNKYEIEIIKPSDEKYKSIYDLCKRNERHSLIFVDDDSDDGISEEFKKWLLNKNMYKDNTIRNYVRYIKDIFDKGYSPIDLYKTRNMNTVVNILDKFKIDEDYIKYNHDNHQTPFNALIQYKEFLDNYIKLDVDVIKGAYNKIYYGVPGSGKSYTVDSEFKNSDYVIQRTTFHPEYTNSDFVGQIIPTVVAEKVKYTFHPGAFTKALEYALSHRNEKVCLIIEEINRGNSSAIFGDIFQLLDRNENGESKYGIYNGPIIDHLLECGINIGEIKIPSNMWIVATMNTSDQNVFTLDTAFKRRWKMEYIKNVFANNTESIKLRDKIIPLNEKYPNITWNKFVNKINEHIIEDTTGINSEDKQLGMYFVSVEEIENRKEFAEKILSYLWEDVAKLNTSYWFGDITSYDELIENYNKNYLDVFNHLFDDEIVVDDNNVIKTVGE